MAALYLPKEVNDKEGRRHKTRLDLARGLFAMLLRWFPDKKFLFLGDGCYASHEFASFFHRHRRRAALVARFHARCSPLRSAAVVPRQGRPRVKGAELLTPRQVVADSRLRNIPVDWYGGTQRQVEICDGTGFWYKSGHGLVPIRWVFDRDQTSTRRDEYC